ncbi:MAG: OmpA family protein [Proteobacteria bacterium]|nr:OmpA family protein [Pseudomonadota bacterium]MBU1641440.1 OmpA family protein [Pseudomonadota bacterium]
MGEGKPASSSKDAQELHIPLADPMSVDSAEAPKNADLDATLARMAAEKSSAQKEEQAALFISGSDEFQKISRGTDESSGSAPWVLTFADLMSLLLCFFILLFAMAELDVKKFTAVAQSLSGALGGGKVIYIRESGSTGMDLQNPSFMKESQQRMETEYYAAELRKDLDEEIKQQKLKVEDVGQVITIHILQHGSFEPASATLNPAFLVTAKKIRDALVNIPGNLTVAGHTDNQPIATDRFLSNWELSGARAFSVINELLKDEVLPATRFVLTGHADTHPRAPNDSEENREKNRRVEIIIDQRSQTGEEQASYEFLRQNLSPEVIRGNIEVQSNR